MIKTVEWDDGVVKLIDQRRLPLEEVIVECRSYDDVARAIKDMQVRGAPAIGVAAAFGIALGATQIRAKKREGFYEDFGKIVEVMGKTRPTAVNLFWAIDRMKRCLDENKELGIEALKNRLVEEALAVYEEDIEINRKLSQYGVEVVPDNSAILTHCNAGALATAGFYGTALGVIKRAHEVGKNIRVFVDETRPFLQGARLTAWELMKDGISMNLITDNMAGFFMQKGEIDLVIVGADRIAANGDAANKIGTYSLAVLAKEHGIPFYVAAPTSTFDRRTPTGESIPIEERDGGEVTHIRGLQLAPNGVSVRNPAFDVTPNSYISAIITEVGVKRQPYRESMGSL
jgi:methylthioribose-1-phosphate isomerase